MTKQTKKLCCAVVGGVLVASAGLFTLFQRQGGNGSNGMTTKIVEGSITQLSTAEQKKSEHEITLHYKWEGKQPHLYFNADDGKQITTYPGVPMKDEGNGWYSYTVSDAKEAAMIISVPELDYQTSQFDRKEGEYWYDEAVGWKIEEPEDYAKTVNIANAENTQEETEEIISDGKSVLSEQNITLHFSANWDYANIYYWNALPEDLEVDWPGEMLELDENGYYNYTFSNVSKVNVLFNSNTNQTEDFTFKKAGEYWYVNGEWIEEDTPIVTDKPNVTTGPDETKKPDESMMPTVTIAPGTGETASFADTRTDFRDESIYFLMTTRFYDGDPGNNYRSAHDDEVGNPSDDPSWRGDFKGLAEKLDYIKALGFSTIWITPVVKNWSEYDYHGYHAYNFKQVDSRYESSDFTYQDLIEAAHAKGIKVVQDIVLNHVGSHGEENLQTLSNGADSIASSDAGNVYHHEGFIKSWESYQCQNTHIDGNCLDLETENPSVIKYLEEAYNQYINMGVDGFRIDTMKHISRLTFNNEFSPAFQETANKIGNNSFYMFGEVCARDENAIYFSHYACISAFFYTWAEDKSYPWGDLGTNEVSVAQHWKDYEDVGNEKARSAFNSDNALLEGNKYHAPDYTKSSGMGVIDFPMHWAFRTAENAFNRGIQDDKLYNDATWNVVYVDSHDYAPNTMEKQRYTGSTEQWAENLDLMFTFRGIPCIYYGSEVEFKKGELIDDYRGKLEDSGRAYFGDYLEGTVTATDFGEYTASGTVSETLSYSLAEHIQRLNKIRQSIPALRKGQYSKEGVNGNMAFKRRYTDENIDSFVCVTISNSATFTGLPGGTYTDAITGDVQTVSEGGTLTAQCSGTGNMRVYVLDTSKTAAPGKVGEAGTYLK